MKMKRVLSSILILVLIFGWSGTNFIKAETVVKDSNRLKDVIEVKNLKEEDSRDNSELNQQKAEYIRNNNLLFNAEGNSNNPNKMTAMGYPSGLHNSYIEVIPQGFGRFLIGTIDGNPDIDTDDDQPLLYGYHTYSYTSYTTIHVDGESHVFGDDYSASSYYYNNSNYTENQFGDISVTQVLSLVHNPLTNREDTVEIKYIVKNNGNRTSNIGVRIMLDTMLGDNDGAPFRVAGVGEVTTETEFIGNQIPQYWQAFDSLSNPKVVAYGNFVAGEILPNKVQFANWHRLFNTEWDYSIQKGSTNIDSAVSIIWERTLEAGQEETYSTLYGVGELSQDLRPPLALTIMAEKSINIDKEEGKYLPYVITAYIENIGNAVAENVYLDLSLPNELEFDIFTRPKTHFGNLKPGEIVKIEKKVHVKEEVDKAKEVSYYISVGADNCDSKTMVRKVSIPPLKKKAIIVVPGIMGSNLVDKNNSQNLLWFDPDMGKIKGLAKVLLSKINTNKDGSSKNKNIIPLSGDNEYGALNIYRELILELQEHSERYNYHVEFVPYDWRMELEDGASRLQKVIAQYDEVSIVAHSMGGLVVEKYIQTRGTDKIKKVVTAGTPYWGSPMAFKALYVGVIDALDIAKFAVASDMKSIVTNFTGLYELLPNQHYTSNYPYLYKERGTNPNFWSKLFKIPKYERLYQDWTSTKDIYVQNFNDLLVEKSIRDHAEIYPRESSSPMDLVDCTMLVGIGEQTEQEMQVIDEILYEYRLQMMQSNKSNLGDGTVPFRSATMNRIREERLNFNSIQKIDNFVFFNHTDHTELVKKEYVINEILLALGIEPKNQSLMSRNMVSEDKKTDINMDMKDEDIYHRILLAADSDIEIQGKNGEKYHHRIENEELYSIEQDENVYFEHVGSYGEFPVVMAYLVEGDYEIQIKSNTSSNIQLALDADNIIYALENYSVLEEDIIKIELEEGKAKFYKNNEIQKPIIVIDGIEQEDNHAEMNQQDYILKSKNIYASIQYNNTIYPNILFENTSDKAFHLKDICFEYVFNNDGHEENRFKCDWAGLNNNNIREFVNAEFFNDEKGNTILRISFTGEDLILNPKDKVEIHTRIHTADWKDYDIWNDISLGTEEYKENHLIPVLYKNIKVID